MLGFLRKHLHKHVRGNIHRPWMQWSIRIYEGVTTFLHGLLWFTGLLFLSGHIAASAVQAGYHLTNVWSHADRIVAMDLGHMGWQELLALASIPSNLPRPPGALTPRSLPAALYPGRARMRGPRAYIRPDE
jgi:hypothetical protein